MLIYLCPTDKKYACSWEGKSEDILHHFEEEHDDLLHFSDTFFIDLAILSENRLLFVEDEIYLAQTKIFDNIMEIKLRYLGPEAISKKITYHVLLKVNYDLCHPGYISVNNNGSITVDLAILEKDIGTITAVECTFNINKDIDDETDDVFVSQVESNERIIEQGEYEDVGLTEENYNMTGFEHLPLSNSGSQSSVGGKWYKNGSKNPDVSLSRSKTISVDDIKRRHIQRAKSTLSLGAISEIDTDSSPNCTECFVPLIPPIFLCRNGHNFCQKCQPGLCPICSEKVTYHRNIRLEENFGKFLLPCKYKKYGCPQKLLNDDLYDHEAYCTFCDYQCPIESCHFEGQFKHMWNHLKVIHGTKKILESFIVTFKNIPEAFLVNEERGIFYCYVTFIDDYVQWKAIFCGPKERRFFCELKFKEGQLKQPVLLNRSENVYFIALSLQDLKRMKVKAKNAILTITS
ncbi:uncharacterized protein LOC130896349 [Diorhabda carinulata]|uniref:uncharacterized protein LOC130896349 n=1 Tax=Diorhabda carinulata TaxID=1163345 RepID=UPI0025A1DAB1|nr:uncharacterized protein LOC130896349 [Diorhabda carinulata]